MSVSPIRFAFTLPLVAYMVARVATSGLAWTYDAAFATFGFVFLAALPFVVPRRGRETWPYAIGAVGAAVSTLAVAQYSFDPTNSAVVLASDLSVAGLVTFPFAAALWSALERTGAGWQVFLIVSAVVGTILLVAGFQSVRSMGLAPSIALLPWGVNAVSIAQAGSLLGQVAGVGPPGAPPLSSALDPTFVAVSLLAVAGAALSWAIPQTDRGTPLPLRPPVDAEAPPGPEDPALRFLTEDDRRRLSSASAPSPPPLIAYPTIRPFVLAALASVLFVAYALTAPQEVLLALAVGASAGVAAVYALGRPPLGRANRPRTSTPP